MKAGFVSNSEGFAITFANGRTVSVQFGEGHYCANRKDKPVFKKGPRVACRDAEAMVFDDEGDSEPQGWLSPEEVLDILNEAAGRS